MRADEGRLLQMLMILLSNAVKYYLCRLIAQASDGELRVESRPGEGSTFTLVLPLA